jgi:hypothetical protein
MGHMMYLVQLLLPVEKQIAKSAKPVFDSLKKNLAADFGGFTAFTQAPAEGVWAPGGREHHDDIIVVEVMTKTLDKRWWHALRRRLERDLDQEMIVIRAQKIEML